MNNTRSKFAENFLFGVATSAYQIEGAVETDGKSPSIWDTFSHTPGKVKFNHNGDEACQHYHLFKDDVNLIKNLGVNAYRFSTAWSRVLPAGWGKINNKGLDFYKRLCEELVNKGIEPYLTLYHWDLPQVLYDKGGWKNRDTLKAFQEYSAIMVEKLGDLVKNWITHNEMWCTAMLGHQTGIFAPGEQNFKNALQVAHGVLVSHGMAIKAMRSMRSDLKLGIAPNYLPAYPHNLESLSDQQAALNFDGYFNRWFLDPLAGKGYPTDMLEIYKDYLPQIELDDMDIIAEKIDFLGVNYYNSNWYTMDENDTLLKTKKVPQPQLKSTVDREIYAQGLYDTLMRIHKDYNFPELFITENGAAFEDKLEADFSIRDDKRIEFLLEHFKEAGRAIKDGVPLKGFFVWSLMDNFEWSEGYTLRYGLYYVDYPTQKRYPKNSALWYKSFIEG